MKFAKHLIIFVFAILTVSVSAQVSVDNTITVEDLVNNFLLGEGVQATNITFNGEPANEVNVQIGLFEGTSTVIDFDEGVVMVSGNAVDQVTGTFGGPAPTNPITNDPDLVAISGQNINDAAVLEFDFVVSSDSLKFNYVFASNEYPSYTCTNFNDAFGFFLSGPGITGPFTDDAINIALIPGTDIPVAINTVNGGAATGGGDPATCEAANPNWIEDSQYFVDNGGLPTGDVQFPGMTVTLTAEAAVLCGEEYHIKLAIGDAFDGALDSGVFLEAGSFQAFGQLDLSFQPEFLDGDVVDQEGLDSIAVAGCSGPLVSLTRPEGATIGDIEFQYSGTAIEGVDFIVDGDLPDNFPSGVDSLAFYIQTINPNITDTLFLVINAIYETCGGIDTVMLSIPIAPPVPIFSEFENPNIFCPQDSVLISVEVTGGVEPIRYDWIDLAGDIDGSSLLVPLPDDQGQYVVEISDRCQFLFVYDTITVTNSLQPPLAGGILPFIGPTCPNEPVDLSASASDGNPPYVYLWTDANGNNYPILPEIEVADINQIVQAFTPNLDVFLTLVDSCGVQVRDSIVINYPTYDSLAVSFGPIIDNCPIEPVELTAETVGGGDDFTYQWDITEGESSFTDGFGPNTQTTFITAGSGYNTFTLTVQDRCHRLGYSMVSADGTNLDLSIGEDTASVRVPFIKLNPLPNIITPNGDGQNEVFVVPGINAFENASVLIYDRWGKLIYENSSYDAGTGEATVSQGFSADGFSDGTYFYIINIDSGECTTQGNLEVVGGSE
jgi:gliding motility-associated-like protein